MPNPSPPVNRARIDTPPGGPGAPSAGGNLFKDIKGNFVRLSSVVPPGYPPSGPGSGFIGSRQRSWTETMQQCTMYAYAVDRSRVLAFNPVTGKLKNEAVHWARLEGTTIDGAEKVYSWVSGIPKTDGGTGSFVVYSTLTYLKSCGFTPHH